MQLTLFWIFSLLMILFALGVVSLRSPISCALSLVGSFLALAALFVTLDAFFIGIIQVLVAAGAVMVLFLFIIMLLNLQAEERRPVKLSAMVGAGAIIFCFIKLLAEVIAASPLLSRPIPLLQETATNDIAMIGTTLFRSFNLPFQIIGVLLLVATVGVVLLSRRTLK
ncbi:MAG: NADH-quinone oxidoreductase subunit J [Chthoniobacterales bacterium]|nr:NADH-quinone oxidoreductase subunit J [Chthoniobacterales bacterium]